MNRTLILASVLALGLAVPTLPAQVLSGEVSPNPAPLGAAVTLTVKAPQAVQLVSGCGIISIHQGQPAGPVVYSPLVCPMMIIGISPGFPWTKTWTGRDNANQPVPAGTYYLRIDSYDPATGNALPPAYFPVRFDDPAAAPPPTLTAGPATLGSVMGLNVYAPAYANGGYLVAASFTTNAGFDLPSGARIALDFDALWDLSFPAANPALFAAFEGPLDSIGQTLVPAVAVPDLPVLINRPLALQAVVFDASGYAVTNPITRSMN